MAHLFEPRSDYHATDAVDEIKMGAQFHEVYVRAAVDVETFEFIHIGVSRGRSDLDAVLFLKTVLKRCCGQPVIVGNRGLWYNWAHDDPELCGLLRETWEVESLVEA